MRSILFEAKNISIKRNAEYLVKHCSFTLYEGEFVSFCQLNTDTFPLSSLFSEEFSTNTGRLFYRGLPLSKRNKPNAFFIRPQSFFVDSLSITDNLLAIRPTNAFIYNKKKAKKRLYEFLLSQNLPFDYRTPILELRDSQRYILALIKGVFLGSSIIILDNITEHCTLQELQWIYNFIQKYKIQGITFLSFSKRENFLVEQSDRIYIFRNRQIADILFHTDFNLYDFQAILHGQTLKPFEPIHSTLNSSKIIYTLNMSGICAKQLSINLHPGEILGIFDCYGNFSKDIFKSLITQYPTYINGTLCKNFESAVKNGLAIIPYPLDDLLYKNFSTAENLIFQKLKEISTLGIINKRAEQYCIRQIMKTQNFLKNDMLLTDNLYDDAYFNKLQLLIQRWELVNPKILIIFHPQLEGNTSMHNKFSKILQNIVAKDCAVIIISVTPTSYFHLCNRSLLLYQYDDYKLISNT